MRRYTALSIFALTVFAFAETRALNQAPASRQASAPRAPMGGVVDPALFKGMQYRLVGPSRGGRVTTVTGVPSQPRTFYMGVASGGLFRTTDAGANWVPIADGKIPVGSMGSIAVADSDPKVIYVGTGSDGVRSNVSTGRGVYKTTDGGDTWQFVGLYDAGQIGAVRIHPTNPDVVWVAAMGDAFKKNDERGIFKTVDGGRTWKKVLFVNDGVGAMDVELQPGNPAVVYAWMSRLERKPWTIISGSRDGGFYKSTNGGDTFTKIATGLPTELIGKANLAVTAAKPDRVYALIEALPGGGFYRSDDSGQRWTLINPQASLLQRPFYYTTLGADPTNADVVYAGAEGFFKSVDAGKTFTALRTPHGDNHDIWINPKDGNTLIQSNDGGANVSTDGGRTWSSQMNQPTAEFYGVWLDEQFPYNLYGAQQDSNTVIITSQATPYAREDWRSGPGCETGPIIPHPKDPNVVYGSCKGQYSVMSLRTGQEKRYRIGAQSLYGNPSSDLIYRMQRVSPMALSPHDPDVLYYGSQYVHRTRDKGVTWEKISPDLTAKPECCQGASGEPITRDVTGEEFYSTLYAITESPLERGVIWTGSNDGPFFVTRDNGKTWTNVTPKDLPSGGRVQWIEASPHRRGSAYYAVYRYLLGDYEPYIYKTDDYGKSWTRLTTGTNGIPKDWPARVVREDPDREGLLYAGTEFGMFISFDNGAHWQSFQLNLPVTPITDIKVHHKDLIVATQGRAFWIVDDISALHQIGASTTTSDVTLYKPRDGYRSEFAALGPMIDYYLPSAASGPVTIEILDGQNAVVNTYSSETPAGAGGRGRGGRGGAAPAADSDDAEAAAGGGRSGRGNANLARVTKAAGMNRFVWDVRTSPGSPFPRWIPGAAASERPGADAALYRPHRSECGRRRGDGGGPEGAVRTQPPRSGSRYIRESNDRQATRGAGSLQGQPGCREGEAVELIAGKLLTQPVRYGRPGLQAHITYLASLTSRGDQKIGRDAVERYAELKKELDAVNAELSRVLGQ